jgi:cytochrome c oxidase subunit II
MNDRIPILALALICLALFGPVPTRAQQDSGAAPESVTIQMTAKKYEFDPSVVTLEQGEHVKLVITALDRDHGFKLSAFNIDQRLRKGIPTTIEFTANQPGEFPFQCSVFCGIGHGRMKGKLVVKAGTGPGA